LIFIVFSTLTEELGSLDHLFVFGIFYCLLILLTLIETKGPLARFFRNPVLINLGLVAYGLYLFHQLVNGLLHDIVFKSAPVFDSGATISVTILAFALTYCLAQATYHAFEKRFIAFGHRFRYTPDRRAKKDNLLGQRGSHSVVPRQTASTEALPN
jgi:peptidoglycan/LPS O-acetylase OafA/YrhL